MKMRKFLSVLLQSKGENLAGQVFRYLVSGGMAFFVDFAVMVLLKEFLDMNAVVAACVGNLVGLIITYLLSVFWIFSHHRFSNRSMEIFIFFLVGISGTGLTYLLMYLFSETWSLHYMFAKIVTVILVTFWNFVAKKLLLF